MALIRQHYQFANGVPFPADMEYSEGTYDFDNDKFKIKVTSSSFKEVPEGHTMPYQAVMRRPPDRRLGGNLDA